MVRSIFAGIVTAIFSLFFFVSFTFFVLLNTVLNVDFYEGEVAEQLYETSVDVLGSAVYRNKGDMSFDFTEEELGKTFRSVLSPEDFEGILVSFLGQVMDPAFDEDGVALITLDLSTVLDKLPVLGEELATKLISTSPNCSEVVDSTGEFCVPEGASTEDLKREIMTALDQVMLSSIPTKIVTFEFREQDLELFPGTQLSKEFLWQVWWMLFAVQAFLLLIVALIILKPWSRVLRWVAKPLLTGSILVSIIFLLLYKLPDLLMKGLDSAEAGVLSEKELSSLVWFAKGILWLIVSEALMYALVIFIVGLVVYISGIWLKHYSHE